MIFRTVLTQQDIIDFLQKVEHEYKTTHTKLCFVKIQRIHRRLLMGYRFGGIKIHSSNLITDGNHRYIAYKLAGIDFVRHGGGRPFCTNDKDLIKINEIIIDFDDDWDINSKYTKKFCTDDFLKKEERKCYNILIE